jgi:hypothetical protein
MGWRSRPSLTPMPVVTVAVSFLRLPECDLADEWLPLLLEIVRARVHPEPWPDVRAEGVCRVCRRRPSIKASVAALPENRGSRPGSAYPCGHEEAKRPSISPGIIQR